MQKIHFIITGGTIDSYYDGTKDTAVPNQESVIPGFIKNLKLPLDFWFTTICMNGLVLEADEATKLVSEGRFVSRNEGKVE